MADRLPISAAIITRNEEANLPDCLKSIAFADQVVVVDSGSEDKTVQIASSFGRDVYTEPFVGFGLQKQFAIDRCTHEWVLVLDADERIPDETAAKIKKIIFGEETRAAGYSFPRKNYFQGRWIKHMGWWPDRVVRLFQKSYGRMSDVRVHESVVINGIIVELDVPIVHITESNLSKLLLKIDRYSSLAAIEAYQNGKRATIWEAALRAKMTFFHNYILRLGLLDKSQGLTLAITDAINKFFKYAKLSEMTRQERAARLFNKE